MSALDFRGKGNVLVKAIKFHIKVIVTKLLLTIIILTAVAASVTGIIRETREALTSLLNKNFYSSISSDSDNKKSSDDTDDTEDVSKLIEIQGNEDDGYYLEFKSDTDDKLKKVLNKNKSTYNSIGVKDVSTLKKFLKAQMVTEYPNLGSSVVGNSDKTLDGCLFIGDSIIKGLKENGNISNNNVQYKGVSKSTPANWSKDESVDGKKTYSDLPDESDSIKSVCVMLGMNAPDEIDEMKDFLEKLHKKYPKNIIFVQKLWTITDGDEKENSNIEKFNNEIKTYCSQNTYLRFIDASSNLNFKSKSIEPKEESYETLAKNIKEKLSIENIGEEENKKNQDKFQGAIKIRRVTPNKNIGEYKDTSGSDIKAENEGNTGEGLGKKSNIPDNIKNKIITINNIPEKSKETLDDLSYLTIPYINFKGDVKDGHMIVDSKVADEILEIFQELYNIKYPINKIEIPEEYYDENDNTKDCESSAIDENDTYSYYYGSTTSQLTGNALVLNPKINPKISNGKAEHENASKYVNRKDTNNLSNEEKSALITKESEAYKIFKKYGWTWNGEDEDNPNYGYFEKKTTDKTNSETSSIDSKVYDLKYVPEKDFDEYVKKNDSKALDVFTLDKNKQVKIATWNYTTDGGTKITEGNTINYIDALSKYSMPIDYLLTLLVHTEDKDFCEGLADLAIQSEYIITIQDKVTTIQTTEKTTTVVKNYNKENDYLSTENSSSKTEVSISEDATQVVEVTYVDCWYFRFSKDYSYSTEYLESTSSKGSSKNLSGEAGKLIGNFTITSYCPCIKCNGKYSVEAGGSGKTKSGTMPEAGLTIASNILPLGTYVMFNNHVYHVEDTGTGLPGNWIDLYVNTHQEALNWGRKTLPVYYANNVGAEKSTLNGNDNDTLSISIDAMGKINKSQTSNTDGPKTTKSTSTNGNYKATTTTKTTTTGTITYEYTTGNPKRSGNSQKFVDLYKSKKCKNVRNVKYVPWIVESLKKNNKTANMVEITEYLFAQATGEKYENSSLVFQEYDPGTFQSATETTGLDTFLEYLHAWEGHEGISADGKKYRIGDDGYGNVTVGYGVDIFNGGHAKKFKAAGYSTKVGDYVPVEFVDNLEKEEIQAKLDQIKAKTSGLNLTQYQLYALVSRAYNCGISGALGTRNGKDFVQAYKAYWNQKKDDQYKATPSDSMYSHKLYTEYMSKPDTAKTSGGSVKSQGLVNRRKSEWILFKTGYYDKIKKYCSNSENGDFLEVAQKLWAKVCNGNYSYGGSNIPCTGSTIDCSSYASWVLYEYGYTEFKGGQKDTSAFLNTNWSKKYGWTEISVGSGENPIKKLQPGDLFVRVGGGTHHITLVVEIKNNKIYCYDCGSANNWRGANGKAIDKSGFLTKSGKGKIIRVTPPK